MKLFAARMLGLVLIALPATAARATEPAYSGSEQCKSCHQPEFAAWKQSHHYQAMQPASEASVLGDFSGTSFEYGGLTSRFYRRDGKFLVETDNALGQLQEFEITHTFGFTPLQQYLVPFPDGRYQALNIVWDSRPAGMGGQRWIHLFPDTDNPVLHDDLVHWTGAFQNWNSRCATCHSTGLKKNYTAENNSYSTTWAEINVACEACHGPASRHLEWASGEQAPGDHGFSFSLADRSVFGPPAGQAADTFSRQDGRHPVRQIETCASCHARRGEWDNHQPGETFDDIYRLSLIEPGLYFPDGQVRDEVYVYGSFLQSKMHQAGVVCTNCHEPHSNKVRADDNSLCTQCHSAQRFDREGHHHHPVGSEGAACINCHMPARTYMVVDDRRDHRFGIPQPGLSLELGIPNACENCHADKGNQWAAQATLDWGVNNKARAQPAKVLASSWSGNAATLPDLLGLADQTNSSPMLRASAISASSLFPAQETLAALQQWLSSGDALLRAAAVQSMDWLPVAQSYALLQGLVGDDSKSVRMAVARQLLEFPANQLPPESADPLHALRREYLAAMKFNADMPEEQMNLGLFHAAGANTGAAEAAYRSALKLAPAYVPAMLNLADLYRANGMDAQALPLLNRALARAPDMAAANHAMGLLKVRQGRIGEAVPFLKKASGADPGNIRYSFVYAISLWETGAQTQAVSKLESVLQRSPGNQELVSALASYYQQLGETEKLQQLMQRYTP